MDYSILVPERSLGPAFCDWLTVTCGPDTSFMGAVSAALDQLPTEIDFSDEYKQRYRLHGFPRASCELKQSRLFHSVSLSGSFLAGLRQTSQLDPFLFSIASAPHTVTRIDVAKDYRVDYPVVLSALHSAYPDGRCTLSRKSLKVTELTATRADGLRSGTWYAGHGQKGNVTGRIYDKSLELLDRTGSESPFPITRVEMTARKQFGATLRDASTPEALFCRLASPAFLEKPVDRPDWVSGSAFTWSGSGDFNPPTDYHLLKVRMESSAEVDRLASLAARMGDFGEEMAIRLLRGRIRAKRSEIGSQEAQHG